MPYIKRNNNLPKVGGTKADGGKKDVGGKNAPGKAADASATPTKEHDSKADKPRSSYRIAAKKLQIANAESLSRQYLLSRVQVPSLKTVPTEA